MNPSSWTGGAYTHITQFLLKILDFLIYPVFLAERYFFMGLIKIFVPLMIALSIFDKTKDYIYNVFKMYARYYLVIIPYAFVVVFANTLFDIMTVIMPVPSYRSSQYGYLRRADGYFGSYSGYSNQNQAF